MTRLVSFSSALTLAAALAVPPLALAQSTSPAPTPKPATSQPPAATAPKAPAPAGQPAPATPTTQKPAATAATAPARPPAFHFNAYGLFAHQQFVAKDSFDAVFGHTSKGLFGGGAQVWHRSGLFVQGDFSTMKDEGERVFVHGSTVYPLGIPLRMELGFFDVGIGYKFVRRPRAPRPPTAPKPAAPAPAAKKGDEDALWQSQPGRRAPAAAAAARPRGPGFRLTPYLGGGFGRVSYKESSDFAQGDDNVTSSTSTYHAFVGVEVPVWKWFGLNVEGFYRWAPDAVGEGGVSAEFSETDLGGPALRLKLTVGK